MDIQVNLAILLIGFTVWIIVVYLLISNAVRSANKELLYYNKMLYRIQLFKMRKEGYSMEEIHSIVDDKEDKFWERLKNNRPPEEEKTYLEELRKIKEYQRTQ